MKVGYLGPAATYTNEAALKQFGGEAELIPMRTIADVFLAVENSQLDYGVVPVENALEGGVTYTLDMFGRADLDEIMICAEIMLPIRSHLMVAQNGPKSFNEIKVVLSHPQALGQARGWLQNNLPEVEIVEETSTSRSAELVAGRADAAAIAPILCAEAYNLNVLASDLQDADFNQTRFFVIYKHRPRWPMPVLNNSSEGVPITAIMLSIKDKVGTLHAVTDIFMRYNINLVRIESRPSKQKAWDYVFFIDLQGQPGQPHVANALHELASETTWAKVLGWWNRSVKA
ncbi:prephenate dehydratase [Candidatus Chlorohelix sp.]|uniref:prephenate dehydratase n=1 Tax=Candidatus Chlorohelix sp. TaxID=3139201 RepID=UPI003022A45D